MGQAIWRRCYVILCAHLVLHAGGIRDDGKMLHEFNTTDVSSDGNSAGETIHFWALTLNRGRLEFDGLNVIINDWVAQATAAGIRLLVLTMQESGKAPWLPALTTGAWTTYRIRMELSGSFSLQTFILANGLTVRTQKIFGPAGHSPFSTFVDDEAPGCKHDQPQSKGCWGARVLHENYGVWVSKGTLITSLEIFPSQSRTYSIMASDENRARDPSLKQIEDLDDQEAPWVSWDWKVPLEQQPISRFTPPRWVARLVVVNSHFGGIKDPLAAQVFKRATQLQRAMKVVRIATGDYRVPAVMLGDWNFRMSPIGELEQMVLDNGGEFPREQVRYSGPVIAPGGSDDSPLQLAMMRDQAIEVDGAYDEVRVAIALARSNAKLPKALEVFREMQADAEMTEAVGYPLTCRFQEGRQLHQNGLTFATLTTPTTLTGHLTDYGEKQMDGTYKVERWSAFEEAGHSIKVKKKGEHGTVTRIPSTCDRVFWTHGQIAGLQLSGFGVQPWVPTEKETQTLLMETDHLALTASFQIAFKSAEENEERQQLQDTAGETLGSEVDSDAEENQCCCKFETTNSEFMRGNIVWVENDDDTYCAWRPKGSYSEGCNRKHSQSTRKPIGHVFLGSQTISFRDLPVDTRSYFCSELKGQILFNQGTKENTMRLLEGYSHEDVDHDEE